MRSRRSALLAVAVVGMPGARKTDLAELLASKTGASTVQLSSVIRDELDAAVEGRASRAYAAAAQRLRTVHGAGVLLQRAVAAATNADPYLILDGIRTRAEIDELEGLTTRHVIVAVHASRAARFRRIRERSGIELQTDEALLAQDEENLRLGVGEVMALAELVVAIDRDMPTLEEQVDWLAGRIPQHLNDAP